MLTKPHRCSLSGGEPYGDREHLWSGKRLDARIRSGRIDWPSLKDRTDPVAVATALLGPPVKRIGSRSAWLCPWHDDHDPSFTVDAKGWRCWACGIGGDAAALVMRHRAIGFPEANRWLAEQAGIAVPSMPTRPPEAAGPIRSGPALGPDRPADRRTVRPGRREAA